MKMLSHMKFWFVCCKSLISNQKIEFWLFDMEDIFLGLEFFKGLKQLYTYMNALNSGSQL